MDSEEIGSAIRRLIEQETVRLTDVPGLLASYGYLEKETDRAAQRRAVVALMRQVLKDRDVEALLQQTFEVHAFRSVRSLFNIDTASYVPEKFWEAFDEELRRLEADVMRLRKAIVRQVRLLEFLSGKLSEIGGEADHLPIPVLRSNLFPVLEYPPVPQ